MNENDVRLLTEVDQRSKSNTHQINEIKEDIKEIRAENKAIYSLVESVKTISENVSDMKSDIKEIKNSQDDLTLEIAEVKNKPAQELAVNWSKIKVAVATSLVTALVMGVFYAVVTFVKP